MATTPTFGWPTPDDTDLVRDGAAAIRALGDAVDAYATGGYLYAGTRYYTSSGTFEKADPLGTGDIGLRAVRVRMVGGGGGGSGAATVTAGQARVGTAGGGGAYSESFILVGALDTSETVTVGAGGTGPSGNTSGGNGGQSSFGTLVTAPGGQGGADVGQAAPPLVMDQSLGGAAGTGDIAIPGETSPLDIVVTDVVQPSVAASSKLGKAGSTPRNAPASGTPGVFGGGGGRATATSAGGGTGGAGGAGLIIVDCYV